MKNSKITVAKTAGFCFGVQRASDLIEQALAEGKKVCTLGPLIHNRQFVEGLEKRGVNVISSPSENTDKKQVVIRSHGVAKSVYRELEELGCDFIDATCPFVEKIHRIASSVKEDELLVIIGDKNHPEVQGIVGHCDFESKVFSGSEELEKFDFGTFSSKSAVIFVAQTTFQKNEWEKCVSIAKKVCTNAKIFDTICNATHCVSRRQPSWRRSPK